MAYSSTKKSSSIVQKKHLYTYGYFSCINCCDDDDCIYYSGNGSYS